MRANVMNLGLSVAILLLSLGCVRNKVDETSDDAPSVSRGRFRFAKSLNSLRIGKEYAYRNVNQYFFFDGNPWAPAEDKDLAQRVGWCDTSPNPAVEVLRCFGDATESYSTTYILTVKNDQPVVTKLDEGVGSVWINDDGKWLLFGKLFYDVETGERIPVKGMPFIEDPTGSRPVQYVIAISPDMKTVVACLDSVPDTVGKEEMLILRIIDTDTGTFENRQVSLTKYPWLREHHDPPPDILPPPGPQKHFVWQKDSSGRDRTTTPELGKKIVKK